MKKETIPYQASCSECIGTVARYLMRCRRRSALYLAVTQGTKGSGAYIRVLRDESDLCVSILEPDTLRFPRPAEEQLCLVHFAIVGRQDLAPKRRISLIAEN